MEPRLLRCALTAAVGALWCAAAGAQIAMKTDVGFKGCYKQGRWVPVTAIIENRGTGFDGELMVALEPMNRSKDTYSRKVTLPANSRKRINLYLPIADMQMQMDVELKSRWRTIAKQEVRLQNTYEEDELVVVVSDEKGALQFLNGKRSPKPPSASTGQPAYPGAGPVPPGAQSGQGSNVGQIYVVYTPEMMVPDRWIGWDGVDAIILGRVSPKQLTAEQQQAILDWVMAGGLLIVTGGADWARLTDPFFEPLLPIVPENATASPLSHLGVFGGAPASGLAQITTGRLRDEGRVMLAEGSVPLIAERDIGLGHCVFLAFDYTQDPVRGWAGAEGMWQEMFSWGIGTSRSQLAFDREQEQSDTAPWYYNTQNQAVGPIAAVSQTPELEPPRFGLVALFLAAYVICLVPVTYAVLKRMRRLELAWVVMPAIILVFSAGAYAIGYSMKGGHLFLNRITVIEAEAGQTKALADSYTLLFSPRRTRYNVTLGTPTAFAQEVWTGSEAPVGSGGLQVDQTDNMALRDLRMDMWASKAFRIRSIADLRRGVDAEVHVDPSGRPEATVSNGTGAALQDVNLILPQAGAAVFVGDIPDGGTIDLSKVVQGAKPKPIGGGLTFQSTNTQSNEIRTMMTGISGALLSAGGPLLEPTLVGWQFEPTPPVTVDGAAPTQRAVDILVVRIPSRLRGAGGERTFRSASFTVGAASNTSTSFWNGSENVTLINSGGAAEFSVLMPFISRAVDVTKAEIGIRTNAHGLALCDVEVYDTIAKQWKSLASNRSIQPGDMQWNVGIAGPDAGRLVNDQGAIRVRLKVRQPQQQGAGGGPAPPSTSVEVKDVSVTMHGKTR
jgi:hypothetical protein